MFPFSDLRVVVLMTMKESHGPRVSDSTFTEAADLASCRAAGHAFRVASAVVHPCPSSPAQECLVEVASRAEDRRTYRAELPVRWEPSLTALVHPLLGQDLPVLQLLLA